MQYIKIILQSISINIILYSLNISHCSTNGINNIDKLQYKLASSKKVENKKINKQMEQFLNEIQHGKVNLLKPQRETFKGLDKLQHNTSSITKNKDTIIRNKNDKKIATEVSKKIKKGAVNILKSATFTNKNQETTPQRINFNFISIDKNDIHEEDQKDHVFTNIDGKDITEPQIYTKYGMSNTNITGGPVRINDITEEQKGKAEQMKVQEIQIPVISLDGQIYASNQCCCDNQENNNNIKLLPNRKKVLLRRNKDDINIGSTNLKLPSSKIISSSNDNNNLLDNKVIPLRTQYNFNALRNDQSNNTSEQNQNNTEQQPIQQVFNNIQLGENGLLSIDNNDALVKNSVFQKNSKVIVDKKNNNIEFNGVDAYDNVNIINNGNDKTFTDNGINAKGPGVVVDNSTDNKPDDTIILKNKIGNEQENLRNKKISSNNNDSNYQITQDVILNIAGEQVEKNNRIVKTINFCIGKDVADKKQYNKEKQQNISNNNNSIVPEIILGIEANKKQDYQIDHGTSININEDKNNNAKNNYQVWESDAPEGHECGPGGNGHDDDSANNVDNLGNNDNKSINNLNNVNINNNHHQVWEIRDPDVHQVWCEGSPIANNNDENRDINKNNIEESNNEVNDHPNIDRALYGNQIDNEEQKKQNNTDNNVGILCNNNDVEDKNNKNLEEQKQINLYHIAIPNQEKDNNDKEEKQSNNQGQNNEVNNDNIKEDNNNTEILRSNNKENKVNEKQDNNYSNNDNENNNKQEETSNNNQEKNSKDENNSNIISEKNTNQDSKKEQVLRAPLNDNHHVTNKMTCNIKKDSSNYKLETDSFNNNSIDKEIYIQLNTDGSDDYSNLNVQFIKRSNFLSVDKGKQVVLENNTPVQTNNGEYRFITNKTDLYLVKVTDKNKQYIEDAIKNNGGYVNDDILKKILSNSEDNNNNNDQQQGGNNTGGNGGGAGGGGDPADDPNDDDDNDNDNNNNNNNDDDNNNDNNHIINNDNNDDIFDLVDFDINNGGNNRDNDWYRRMANIISKNPSSALATYCADLQYQEEASKNLMNEVFDSDFMYPLLSPEDINTKRKYWIRGNISGLNNDKYSNNSVLLGGDIFNKPFSNSLFKFQLLGGTMFGKIANNSNAYNTLEFLVGPKISLLNKYFVFEVLGLYRYANVEYSGNNKNEFTNNIFSLGSKLGLNISLANKFLVQPYINALCSNILTSKPIKLSNKYQVNWAPGLALGYKISNSAHIIVDYKHHFKPILIDKKGIDLVNPNNKGSNEFGLGVNKTFNNNSVEVSVKGAVDVSKEQNNTSKKNNKYDVKLQAQISKSF